MLWVIGVTLIAFVASWLFVKMGNAMDDPKKDFSNYKVSYGSYATQVQKCDIDKNRVKKNSEFFCNKHGEKCSGKVCRDERMLIGNGPKNITTYLTQRIKCENSGNLTISTVELDGDIGIDPVSFCKKHNAPCSPFNCR